MKRELLFDAVFAAEAEAKARGPQVWQSILDIPPNTVAKPERGDFYLYVTPRGRGWWVTGKPASPPDVIGWKMDDSRVTDSNKRGPFTEVQLGATDTRAGVWDRVYDVPFGTLVRPEKGEEGWLLYVTTSGKGWWLIEKNTPETRLDEIRRAERSGWALGSEEQDLGPFTEVAR